LLNKVNLLNKNNCFLNIWVLKALISLSISYVQRNLKRYFIKNTIICSALEVLEPKLPILVRRGLDLSSTVGLAESQKPTQLSVSCEGRRHPARGGGKGGHKKRQAGAVGRGICHCDCCEYEYLGKSGRSSGKK